MIDVFKTIKIEILKQFYNRGISLDGFFFSRKQCQEYFKNMTNNSSLGNRPIDYATKDIKIIDLLNSVIEKYIEKDSTILELGSNCGANLNGLSKIGYTNLSGIEINQNAIDEMRTSFPGLKANVTCSELESALPKIKDNSFDLVFSMAVLLHIHPSSHSIFKDMVRISRGYICVIESERFFDNHIFPRNYKKVFEGLGCKQIMKKIVISPKTYPELNQYFGYTIRLFKKGI